MVIICCKIKNCNIGKIVKFPAFFKYFNPSQGIIFYKEKQEASFLLENQCLSYIWFQFNFESFAFCVRDVVTFRGRSNENFREETGYQLGLFWVSEQSSYAERLRILLIFLHFCMLFLWILYQVTMPKDSTEVSCCVKYLLFFFNVFFWVSLHDKYTNIHIMVICWQVTRPSRENEYKTMHNTITWSFLLPVWITWCYKFYVDKYDFSTSTTKVVSSLFPFHFVRNYIHLRLRLSNVIVLRAGSSFVAFSVFFFFIQ